jgi:Zn-finger nucleic acid-binding protein
MDPSKPRTDFRGPETLRCLYCGRSRKAAALPCDSCGAEPPSVPCASCGRPVAAPLERCTCGVPYNVWGTPDAEGIICPRCQGRLWRVQLDVTAVHVEQCSRCLGCFVRTEDYSELVAREEAGGADGLRRFVPVGPGRELPRQALLVMVHCPYCKKEMERIRFADRASLIVDICSAHGIWLDAGELAGLLDFVKERSTKGFVEPGPIERTEEETWNRISAMRATEALTVELHASRAERLSQGGTVGGVVAATAVGGPWLGLFVALRNRSRRT